MNSKKTPLCPSKPFSHNIKEMYRTIHKDLFRTQWKNDFVFAINQLLLQDLQCKRPELHEASSCLKCRNKKIVVLALPVHRASPKVSYIFTILCPTGSSVKKAFAFANLSLISSNNSSNESSLKVLPVSHSATLTLRRPKPRKLPGRVTGSRRAFYQVRANYWSQTFYTGTCRRICLFRSCY